MEQIITDELLEVVVSLRFASNYKGEFFRGFFRIIRKGVECLTVERTEEAEEVTDS
jgi:hypothetical protein